MNKFVEFLKNIISEIDPVIELFIYVGIAKVISILLGITFIQAISIVYIYFILNLARIGAEILRNKYR